MKRSSASPSGGGSQGRMSTTSSKVKRDEPAKGSHSSSDFRPAKSSTTKTGWTLDELDLNKDILPLLSLIGDRQQLSEKLFQVLSSQELASLIPASLREIPLTQLKQLCTEQLNDKTSLPDSLIESVLLDDNSDQKKKQETNLPLVAALDENKSEKSLLQRSPKEATKTLSRPSSPVKAKGPATRDVEIQVASSSELSSDEDNKDEAANEKSNEGWMNLWAKTQMEILELEMRARAIRSLLKKDEQEEEEEKEEGDSGAAVLLQGAPGQLIKSHSHPQSQSGDDVKKLLSSSTGDNSSHNIPDIRTFEKTRFSEITSSRTGPLLSASASERRSQNPELLVSDETDVFLMGHDDDEDSIDRELRGNDDSIEES